jgi:hypothetical protein
MLQALYTYVSLLRVICNVMVVCGTALIASVTFMVCLFVTYSLCTMSSKLPQYDTMNIGFSDTLMINYNQWRASSLSVIHIRNSGVPICFKICKGKDGLAVRVTFACLKG